MMANFSIVLLSVKSFFANVWSVISGVFSKFLIKDAIDIILVTMIIFVAIKFFRETRAAQLVKGILVVIFAYFIANQFELMVLESILSYFFQFAWIAILIVFQPELRNALERVGRTRTGKSLFEKFLIKDNDEEKREKTRHAINIIANAAGAFQQTKTGALIVCERESKLGEIVASGTLIDAEVSAELIGNIFFNKAPLHDGAMVVKDGRISAAGCILPLTSRDNVRSELGTRHRAAIGLSEVSDAVVVVVSEETGQISIAENGTLKRDYTRETLSVALEKRLIKSSSDSSVKRKLPFIKKEVKKNEE